MGWVERARAWGQWIMSAAMLTVLSFSPAELRQQRNGRISYDVVKACWPLWPWLLLLIGGFFGVLFGLAFEVAAPLGLTQLAADLIIRVVVLELAPLLVAMVVLIKITLPQTMQLRRLSREQASLEDAWEQGLHFEALPRILASFFAVVLISLSLTQLLLLLSYLQLYGFNPSGFNSFTRQIGLVFEPAMAMAWLVNIFLLAWCVSLLPMATLLVPSMAKEHNADVQLQTLIRVVLILVVIKLLSLTAAYA
jgi:phospholipid/cholesterol/gamma-HCH transport system permease protein